MTRTRAVLVLLVVSMTAGADRTADRAMPARGDSCPARFQNVPLGFVEGVDSSPSAKRFSSFGGRSRIAISPAGVDLGSGVVMRFAGANPAATMTGESPLPTRVHYFLGNDPARWRRDRTAYRQVRYHEVYRGVDVLFYGSGRHVEYDIQVAPSVRPHDLRIDIEGAREVGRNETGDVVIRTQDGEILHRRPRIYQTRGDERVEIRGEYVLESANRLGFRIGPYDATRPLTIDPVIEYSRLLGSSLYDQGNAIAVDAMDRVYVAGQVEVGAQDDAVVLRCSADGASIDYVAILGGSASDNARGIAVDASGDAYVAGNTLSKDFPVRAARQPSLLGTEDAFVLKLNAQGSDLLFSTYLGGAAIDTCSGMALNSRGEACVVGRTTSCDFPLERPLSGQGGFRPILRSSDAGSTWALRSEGLLTTSVRALAVKPLESTTIYAATQEKGVFVTTDGGLTWSARNTGISTQLVNALVIDPAAPSLLYAGTATGVYKGADGGLTWLPSSRGLGDDAYVASLAIDPRNSAVLFAGTIGIVTPLGGTGGVFKSTDAGQSWTKVGYSGHVGALAIDPVNSAVVYAGYRVRSQFDSGGVYKSTDGGSTWQSSGSIPSLFSIDALAIDPGTPSIVYGGGDYLYKTTNGGATWTVSDLPGTYPHVRSLAVDPSSTRTLYAGTDQGLAKSTTAGLSWTALSGPVKGADVLSVVLAEAPSILYVSTRSGSDAFATMFRPDGTLAFSTYLGGTGEDSASGVAIDLQDSIYVTGSTQSSDLPTVGPYQTRNAGGNDVFVTKIDSTGAAVLYSTYLGGTLDDYGSAIAVSSLGEAFVTGYTYSTTFPTIAPLQATLDKQYGAFVAKFDSTGAKLLYSTFLRADFGEGIAVDGGGNIHLVGRGAFVRSSYAKGAAYAKIDPSGLKLDSFYYAFPSNSDDALAVAVDSQRRAVVTGYVTSAPGGYGGSDLFLLKLSDRGPILDIQMSKDTYSQAGAAQGEPVRVEHFRLRNNSNTVRSVALTLTIEAPGPSVVTLLSLGSDGSLVLPPNLDAELGPFDLFVPGPSNLGVYLFTAEMRDPATAGLISQDLAGFSVR